MGSARDFIRDEMHTLLEDPTVSEQLISGMRESMKNLDKDNLVKEMSSMMLKMARNKKTGKLDIRRLKSIKNDLEELKNKGKSSDAKLKDVNFPRFLTGASDDGEFCDGDGADALRNLLKSFLRPAVSAVLEAISSGFEVASKVSLASRFFKLTNFWDDDGPFSTLLEGLVDIFQVTAALILFGDSDDLETKLPSNSRVLPIQQTRSGDVYMASGCDSNFEGELEFYGQIEDVIIKTLTALSEAIGQWINAPIELVKWLLEMLFRMFSHMSKVCAYLDDFVQGAYVEGTFENTRYILQEVACRPVAVLARGSGCDGIDNNCDFERDECAEDTFPPKIDSTLARSECGAEDKYFDSEEAAEECILARTTATDDCGEVTGSVNVTFETQGKCTPAIKYTAKEFRCMGESFEEIIVKVDSTPPTVICDLTPPAPFTGTDSMKVQDAGFTYSATDNCSPDNLKVSIELFSNEIVATVDDMAWISEPNSKKQIKVSFQDNYCKNQAGSCRVEWPKTTMATNAKSREYMVRVVATDEAGNVGTCETNLFVQTNASAGSPLYHLKTMHVAASSVSKPTNATLTDESLFE